MFKNILLNAWRTPSTRRKIYAGLFGSIGAGLLSYKMYSYYISQQKISTNAPYDINKKLYNIYLESKLSKIPFFEEESESDWELITEKDGCKIYSLKVPYSDYYVVKGSVVTKTRKSVKNVLTSFFDVAVEAEQNDTYKKVSPNNVYMKLIRREKNRALVHARWTTDHRWLVKDRDFIILNQVVWYGDKYGYISGGSVDQFQKEEHKGVEYPIDPDCVRGNFEDCLWRVKRIDKDHLLVEFISHVEPKGYIPIFIYNMSAKRQGYSCLKMAQEVLGEETIVNDTSSKVDDM